MNTERNEHGDGGESRWTPLSFGKHDGKTLPQVLLHDPDWFFWAMENHAFRLSANLLAESQELDRKARSIKLVMEGYEVEYLIHPGVRKLASVHPVLKSQPLHQGSSRAYRLDVLDLSFPRRFAPYDKMGSKFVLQGVKAMYFRDKSLTKSRCEAFFEDDANFVL